MSRGWCVPILAVAWGGAFAAILKLFCVGAPKRLAAAIGLVLGWFVVVAFGQLLKCPPAEGVDGSDDAGPRSADQVADLERLLVVCTSPR